MCKKIQLSVKRFLDIVMSIMGIMIFSLPMLVSSFVIYCTIPGSVLFKQERVGKDNKKFKIWKFRTMKPDEKAEREHDFSKDDERVTRFGKILRRTKMDELPQLFNVLIGDMSLVGPRPTVKEQVETYTERQMLRLTMRPGMTGLAQVNGNATLSWDERIKYDIKYVKHFSLALDTYIICKTVGVIIFGEGHYRKFN